jgi:GDSL-like Lipase/Acylhydrolase family
MIRRVTTLLAICALATVLAGPGNAAAPPPPFTQCPAVGADTSCALLIYIDASGTPSVLGDPAQGPYDEIEDTLIGVQNDSSFSIASLPVSSTVGKALFGFDGDGLCNYIGCSWDAPTGYEGPGVSFTDITADLTSGTVKFSPAIPPGGHAYFGLEEALSTVPPFDINPGPPAPGDIHMVALGDSYSTAQGTDVYDSGKADAKCNRGPGAWPRQLQQDSFDIVTITHLACTGEKSTQLFGDYNGNPPQISLQPKAAVELVTITIGGDDIGFASILGKCYYGSCAGEPSSPSFQNRLNNLALSLRVDVYPSLRIEYPNALIVHVGYPRILPPPGTTPVNCGWFGSADQQAAEKMRTMLDATIATTVASFHDPHVIYAPVTNALAGHELCTADSWMNPVLPLSHDAGHPTLKGYTAYMKAVAADLGIGLKPGF